MDLTREDVDRVTSPDYVAGLTGAPVDELREKRAECRRVEGLVSYLRRVVQGQIDLVVAEMELRLLGLPGDHDRLLVDALPSILAGTSSGQAEEGRGQVAVAKHVPPNKARLSTAAVTEVFAWNPDLSLEDIASVIAPELAASVFRGGALPGASLASFDDASLAELVARLSRHEASLSAMRRVLHERIDTLEEMVSECYEEGTGRAEVAVEDDGTNDG